MNIDKEKLKALLWSVKASLMASGNDLERHTEALDEFIGEKTIEEVALVLLVENERLERNRDMWKGQVARQAEKLTEMRKALSDLLALYDADEGCRRLPQYIAGCAVLCWARSNGHERQNA